MNVTQIEFWFRNWKAYDNMCQKGEFGVKIYSIFEIISQNGTKGQNIKQFSETYILMLTIFLLTKSEKKSSI